MIVSIVQQSSSSMILVLVLITSSRCESFLGSFLGNRKQQQYNSSIIVDLMLLIVVTQHRMIPWPLCGRDAHDHGTVGCCWLLLMLLLPLLVAPCLTC